MLNSTNKIAANMKNKTKQKIATVSSLILGLTFGLSNQPVQATGGGCSFFGLDGNTCIQVVGDGLAVNSVQGSFGIGNFQSCISNWRYRISYQDKNHKEYAKINGPTHNTCDKQGVFTYGYNTKPYIAKEGRVCASLYANYNTFQDSACANITP